MPDPNPWIKKGIHNRIFDVIHYNLVKGLGYLARRDATRKKTVTYINRAHAGQVLAQLLKDYANRDDVILLALPRGGVPVAYEIAMNLSLALDLLIVRKLGLPGYEELAMGAIASGGITVFNEEVLRAIPINKSAIDAVVTSENEELNRREYLYRGDQPYPDLTDKTIILVDDGMATGSTIKAAVLSLQQKKPADIIIAVPVAAQSTCEEMAKFVKKIICPLCPTNFHAVGLWYDDFSQTTDEEVIELLERARQKNKEKTWKKIETRTSLKN